MMSSPLRALVVTLGSALVAACSGTGSDVDEAQGAASAATPQVPGAGQYDDMDSDSRAGRVTIYESAPGSVTFSLVTEEVRDHADPLRLVRKEWTRKTATLNTDNASATFHEGSCVLNLSWESSKDAPVIARAGTGCEID